MLCLGQERRGLCPWPRRSPASVSPLDGKGKEQTKTECKTCEALSARAALRGVVLHGAVWGMVLLEAGGQSGGSVGEGSARPRGAPGVSSALGIELRGVPRAEPRKNDEPWGMPGSGGDTGTPAGTRGWGAPGGCETSEECGAPGEGC